MTAKVSKKQYKMLTAEQAWELAKAGVLHVQVSFDGRHWVESAIYRANEYQRANFTKVNHSYQYRIEVEE